MIKRGSTIAGLVAGLLVLGSCSSSGAKQGATNTPTAPASSATTQPKVLPGHTFWTETFVDTSRPTAPEGGTRLPSRTLVTAFYRPNGAGPFPLIMFSHGLGGHPEKFTKLLSAWADAGFAVAAPAFPLTNSHVKNAWSHSIDGGYQPGDVSFVLDKVVELNRKRSPRLPIDADRIGAGGLSLGGFTTYELVYGKNRDERISAAEVLDGFDPSVSVDGHVPLLVAHSDTDPLIPYSSAQKIFVAADPPAWFVSLHGASHESEWENAVTPYDHLAESLTTDFWDATLNGDARGFVRLQQDATVADLSSIAQKLRK